MPRELCSLSPLESCGTGKVAHQNLALCLEFIPDEAKAEQEAAGVKAKYDAEAAGIQARGLAEAEAARAKGLAEAEAIKAKVKEIADKLGVEANMKNMGVLMKSAMAELKDKADGSAVNKAVKEFLSGK